MRQVDRTGENQGLAVTNQVSSTVQPNTTVLVVDALEIQMPSSSNSAVSYLNTYDAGYVTANGVSSSVSPPTPKN